MSLTKRSSGYQLAETYQGDTVQKIAARVLGDASRWPELVAYNNLVPPYVVDDLAGIETSGDGLVLISGMHIRVPVSKPASDVSHPTDIFGSDLRLDNQGFLGSENGSFALVSDISNLRQALGIRLNTELRELVWHPKYGNPLFKYVGVKSSPAYLQLTAAQGEQTVRADPRISDVEQVVVTIDADSLLVEVDAVAADGRDLSVKADI